MKDISLHHCLPSYADPASRNYVSDVFQAALVAHLEGLQADAIAMLLGLEHKVDAEWAFFEKCEVRFLIAHAYVAQGEPAKGEFIASQILEEAESVGELRWRGLAFHILAAASIVGGHGDYAVDTAARARKILTAFGSQRDIARACHVLGTALLMVGDLQSGRRELQVAANIAAHAGDHLIQAMASRRLGVCLLQQGQYEAAAQSLADALHAYGLVGATRRVEQTQHSLAVLALTRGDLEGAREHVAVARELRGGANEGPSSWRWNQVIAWLDILDGRFTEAEDLLRAAADFFRAKGAQRDAAVCLEFLGDALGGLGRPQEALEAIAEAVRIGRMVSESADVVVECLRKKGDLHARLYQLPDAVRAARQALRLTRKYQDRLEIAAIKRLRGLIKLLHGRKSLGLEFLQTAWSEFERIGASLEARLTAQLLSEMLTRVGLQHEANVWRKLGGTPNLPTLRLHLPAPQPQSHVVPPKSRGLRALAEQAAEQGIITRDPRVLGAFELTVRGAPSRLPLLIFGETGTGKELFAAVAHRSSGRSGPFVAINCAALPPDLLDAELFGHARGAYTGAMRDRPGLIEAATGGSLFLDEIGEMSLPVQGRLLRAIELGEIRRIGENSARRVDVRFVGATHRDLQEMVRQGSYRADLFFRLRGIVVVLPPLRERPWDIDLLADHFLAAVRRESGVALRLTQEARERMRVHPWPGNVRELKSMVERLAALRPDDGLLDAENLGLDPIRVAGSLEEHLEEEERRRLIATLESVQWNRSRAARLLRLKRTTLLGKMRRLGITPPKKK